MDAVVADYKAGKITVADLWEMRTSAEELREILPSLIACDPDIENNVIDLLKLASELLVTDQACFAASLTGDSTAIHHAVEVYSECNVNIPGGYPWRYTNTCVVFIENALKYEGSEEYTTLLDVLSWYSGRGLVAYYLATYEAVNYDIVKAVDFDFDVEMNSLGVFDDNSRKRGINRLLYFRYGDV